MRTCPGSSTSAILPDAMDRATVNVYETKVDDWIEHRRRARPPSIDAFVGARPAGRARRRRLRAGLAQRRPRRAGRRVRRRAPRWPRRSARSRPTRGRSSPTSSSCRSGAGALTGAWAHKSYMHIAAERLPMALADLHRSRRARRRVPRAGDLRPSAREPTTTCFPAGTSRGGPPSACATSSRARASRSTTLVDDGEEWIDVEATRAPACSPDTVGPGHARARSSA